MTPLFQTLAGLNVLMYMLGSWGFNVIVKTFKGLERSMWNRRMVRYEILSFRLSLSPTLSYIRRKKLTL